MSDLVVAPVANESATFHVTGRTLYCEGECKYTYKPVTGMSAKHADGDRCPKCERGTLRRVPYLVELKLYGGLGKCGCPRWQFALQPLVSRLAPLARIAAAKLNDDLKCDHVLAAYRVYAVDKACAEASDGEGGE